LHCFFSGTDGGASTRFVQACKQAHMIPIQR
jgi:hypothetical protein